MTHAAPFQCLDTFEILAFFIVIMSICSGVWLTYYVVSGYGLKTFGELSKTAFNRFKRTRCNKNTSHEVDEIIEINESLPNGDIRLAEEAELVEGIQ